jgi:hypothetical protein
LRVEAALAALTGVLTLVTAVWHDWVELVFGVEPDAGSGALEWGLVVALAGVTIGLALAARREHRRVVSAEG